MNRIGARDCAPGNGLRASGRVIRVGKLWGLRAVGGEAMLGVLVYLFLKTDVSISYVPKSFPNGLKNVKGAKKGNNSSASSSKSSNSSKMASSSSKADSTVETGFPSLASTAGVSVCSCVPTNVCRCSFNSEIALITGDSSKNKFCVSSISSRGTRACEESVKVPSGFCTASKQDEKCFFSGDLRS